MLGIVNPFLAERIDWWSFAASQVMFGLVAGYVVTKLGQIKRLHRFRWQFGLAWRHRACRPTATEKSRSDEDEHWRLVRVRRWRLALAGCNLPGKPRPEPEVPRPETVLAFETLYGANCAGCHGENGQNGAATNLANPEYQALMDDATLHEVIAKGEKGTLMPAFAQENGGMLTDEQIDALVAGDAQRWRKAECVRRRDSAAVQGDACGRCSEGAGSLCDGLRALSWSVSAAAGEGRIDSGWIVSGADQ